MTLTEAAFRRRRSLLFVLAITMAAGLLSAFWAPVSLFPTVLFPRIAVTVDAGDRPASQTEAVITRPVEQAIRAIPGVQTLRSTTSRGSTEISVNFAWGSDMDLALQRVQAALARAGQDLPAGANVDVRRMDPTVFPVAAYSLTSDRMTPVELRRFADLRLGPVLSTIPGVARVEDQGGAMGEYQVIADPARLAAHGLTIGDLATAIANAKVVTTVGRLEDQGKLLLVLADTQLDDPGQVEAVAVKSAGGAVTRVGDVAQVVAAPAPHWDRVTADGHDAVLINVLQQPGGNTVQIAQAVRKSVSEVLRQAPADLKIKAWYDQSDLILESARALRNAILIGVVLAGLVLLAFLRDWRMSLAAILSAPMVLAATTLVLRLFGQGFNIMTLGGMAAAIGLIIDDAIVMIEHIDRRAAEGQGAALGAVVAEFVRPLLGSSLATVVIFVPLAFLDGVTGAFFRALSVTMAVALTFSFLIAWWVTPSLVQGLQKGRRPAVAHATGESRFTQRYRGWLQASVRRPRMVAGGLALFAALGVACLLTLGSGFMPKVDEGGFILDYVAPPGMSVTETDRLMRQIEAIIRATPDVDTYSRRTGLQLGGGLTEPNTGDFFIRLKPSGRRPIEEVMDDIAAQVQASVPHVDIETAQLMEDLIGDLTAVPEPIEVKLYSEDAGLLAELGPKVQDAISHVPGVVEAKSGIVAAGDGLDIRFDPTRCALEGIDPGEAAKQVQDMLSGAVATQIQSGQRLVNVRVWPSAEVRSHADQVGGLMLRSAADGHLFPVSRVAVVTETAGEAEINRENLRQMDAVTARVEGRDTGSAAQEVQRLVGRPGFLPAGVSFEMGGLYAQQQQAFRGLALVFAAAVAAVFALLLFLYENFRVACAILVPPLLAALAVAIGLWLARVELNIMALMGATMILGIATEVAIFYFSEYQALVAAGTAPETALIEAGVNRLRPIAMTTLAAILALAPLALALGGRASMERPLAIAIIAGLFAQGPLTLLAMPAIYKLIGGLRTPAP